MTIVSALPATGFNPPSPPDAEATFLDDAPRADARRNRCRSRIIEDRNYMVIGGIANAVWGELLAVRAKGHLPSVSTGGPDRCEPNERADVCDQPNSMATFELRRLSPPEISHFALRLSRNPPATP